MILKKIILFAIVLTGFSSCNQDLKEEIFSTYSSSNFFNTEEQLQAQNIGIYAAFGHVVWEQDMFFLVSMMSKYATSKDLGNAIFSAYSTPETQPFRYERIWNVGFDAIARANTAIKYIPTSKFFADRPEVAKQYLAEARWMRAYTYFQLTQLFGDLPLRKEPVETLDPAVLYLSRSSTKLVYDLIIEDLIYANENLPVKWTKTGTGRVTKAGGAFLLGKVYLTSAGLPLQITANYQKAIDVLKPLADSPSAYNVGLETNWKGIFSLANEGNKEIIFAHGNVYQNLLGGVLPFWSNPQFSTLGGVQAGTGSSYAIAWHPNMLNLYESTDVRLADGFTYSYVDKRNGNTITYSKTPLVSRGANYEGRNGICSTKYIDGGASGNVIHSKDHIVYRYVDAFLMLAEAYNENGTPANALPYLKIARDRVKASVITTTVQATLRTVIREERTRELYAEMGEMFDLRRWGTSKEEFNSHLLRLWRNPGIGWDDKYILCPIPAVETSKNQKLLPNNPGW